jgi:hypothetical protein
MKEVVMMEALRGIVEKSFEQLAATLGVYLPNFLACAVILISFFLLAVFLRWVVLRIFKGANVDRFLHQTGVYAMLDRSGRLRASRLVAGIVYWATLCLGLLTGLSAFNTEMTTRMINAVVFLMPKLVTALAIVLVGAWLGQYLGRSMLIWACNEGLPSPRNLSAGVRILIVFVAVVAAAEHLDFARTVFLAAFIIVVGGMVAAASIAVGISIRDVLRRRISPPVSQEEPAELTRTGSLWNHL